VIKMQNLLLLESGSRSLLAITIENVPTDWQIESCELVTGSVVISLDYFKRFVAGLRGIVGGNIRRHGPRARLRHDHQRAARDGDVGQGPP
jgi:uncharacterized protein YbjQ (UPF0145 family)